MTSKYGNILEEELKNKVAHDYFPDYDTTQIIGKIDFCVALPPQPLFETQSLLWAEAKSGTKKDIYESFVQLILTIGRARTFDTYLPPKFLGAFDAEKIAFLPYGEVIDIFYQNDFNWNVTPSDHESKEFRLLYDTIKTAIEGNTLLFHFLEDDSDLRKFIRANFKMGEGVTNKIRVNKNNFTHVFQKWLKQVKPTISIDWEEARKENLLDVDFFLADLLSQENISLKDKLFVLLRTDRYIYNIRRKATGAINFEIVDFSDNQVAHTQFWNKYHRPPKREYWDYIVERRDLLVPQDIRERKGSYFTPRQWVELSQQYLADELGEDWQDEYYVWDCAAGTGNLLAGLTNKYHIWASTLDDADVRVMKDLIAANKLNLLESHVFQFDFLNDSFDKLPQGLRDIVGDPEKRKKLVVYINPPYKEAANKRTISGLGKNTTGVAVNNLVYQKYASQIGIAGRELFAQFFIRIYSEIPSSVLAEFSTLKILQAPNFKDFRKTFRAKLGQNFLVPANTFDNVKGEFPIGFFIWHLNQKSVFVSTNADVYDSKCDFIGTKTICLEQGALSINEWIIQTRDRDGEQRIGYMSAKGNDFQNTNYNFIINDKNQLPHPRGTWVTNKNIKEIVIYLSVRHSIPATWLNDRDQFRYPNDGWQADKEFQSDCLAYTLFHGQNRISVRGGVNHWIPFTEAEVDAKDTFQSHFMSDYIRGKAKGSGKPAQGDLFADNASPGNASPIVFSPEAQAVMNAGRELWRYYHAQPGANPNAAFYDIRLHFQGVNDKGKMNTGSEDERYNQLMTTLRERMKTLATKIEPKVYEYGFLLK